MRVADWTDEVEDGGEAWERNRRHVHNVMDVM